ncbi:hypothetical protein HJC23_009142 [Cyclotella cryptica]|uniref:BTB domain-containing protein n=1 Tax=Cyclotella cryptica TaxID=29204 RepID=A0ABD3P1V4_9STRA
MDDILMDENALRLVSSTAKVNLNVGGKKFEVSRSLINQYSDSMIGKLVSDTWSCKTDRAEAIFIDRDGDLFGYVLNYMRYGSIELPVNLPKTMFQRELDFYGLPSTYGIKQKSSIETMRELQHCVENAELHHDMLLIATSCYHQYMVGKKVVHIGSDELLKHSPFYYHYPTAMKVLNYYLKKFHGLEAASSQASLFSTDFILEVKELTKSSSDTLDDPVHNIFALPAPADIDEATSHADE